MSVIKHRIFGSQIEGSIQHKLMKDQVIDIAQQVPMVRMWTAVETQTWIPHPSKNKRTYEELIEQKGDKLERWANGGFTDTANGLKNVTLIPFRVEDNQYQLYYLDPDKKRKVYEIGNYDHNTFEPKMYDIIDDGYSTLGIKKISMEMGDLANNPYNSPPAGITSVSSTTEGSIGAIKKTTVNFVVHNFIDFQDIYSKFFMKPGAQIFIDFGWNDFPLYDPRKIIDDHFRDELNCGNDLYECLYGDDGFVTASAGSLETLFGFVTNFESTLRDDGGFDCNIEVVSQNNALLDFAFDERDDFKRKFTDGINAYIINLVAAATDEEGRGFLRSNWLASPDNLEESALYANSWAREYLVGAEIDTGGYDKTKREGAVSIRGFPLLAGVYWQALGPEDFKQKNAFTKNNNLFINWGFFEQEILNKELRFDADETISFAGDGEFSTKFTSVGSYVLYSDDLFRAQRIQANFESGNKTKLKFLYPDHWETGYTYSTIGMKTKLKNSVGKPVDKGTMDTDELDKILKETLNVKLNLQGNDYKPSPSRIRREYVNINTWLANDIDTEALDQEIIKAISEGRFIFEPDEEPADGYLDKSYAAYGGVFKLEPPPLTDIVGQNWWEDYGFHSDTAEINGISVANIDPDDPEWKKYLDNLSFSPNEPVATNIHGEEIEEEDTTVFSGGIDEPDEYITTNIDKEDNKIPFQELFINISIIKNAFSRHDSVNDAVIDILNQINAASGNIFDLKLMDTTGDGTKISVIDTNLSGGTDDVSNTDRWNGIFTFNIMGKNSVVKNIDMTFETPKNGLQNMIAIQNGSTESLFPTSSGPGSVEQNNGIRVIENPDLMGDNPIFYSYLPGVSNENLLRKKLGIAKGRDDTKSADTSMLKVDPGNLSKLRSWDNIMNNVKDAPRIAEILGDVGKDKNEQSKTLRNINLGDFTVDLPERTTTVGADWESDPVNVNDIIYASSIEEYFTSRVKKQFFTQDLPSLIPITLRLTINGTSGIKPGNIFKINYLPAKYKLHTFFQVTNVSHEVSSETWSTTLESVMRIRPHSKRNNHGRYMYANPSRVRMSDNWVNKLNDSFFKAYKNNFSDFYLMNDLNPIIPGHTPFFWRAVVKKTPAQYSLSHFWFTYKVDEKRNKSKDKNQVWDRMKTLTVTEGSKVYIIQDMNYVSHNLSVPDNRSSDGNDVGGILIIKEKQLANYDKPLDDKFLYKLYTDREFVNKIIGLNKFSSG